MAQTTWIPSDEELEPFGLMTFDTGADETGGGNFDEDEDDLPPSQG